MFFFSVVVVVVVVVFCLFLRNTLLIVILFRQLEGNYRNRLIVEASVSKGRERTENTQSIQKGG